MKTKDFDYYLPEELIAQTPLEKRDESRLMCLDKETGELSHHHFYELPNFLNPGDCLILNNSRVLPARLLGQRLPGGGACEVLLLIDRGDKTWECIVRPGKHLRKGTKMQFGNGELKAEVVDVLPDGNRMVKFDFEGIFLEVLEHLGKMPLPPYIKEELQDQERYQTVYSKVNGRADGGPALHAGAAGKNSGKGREHRLCDAACRPRYVPSCQGGRHRAARYAQRILRYPA